MTCPRCGGVMEKVVGGIIDEPVMTPFKGLARHTRLATFYACSECEHCEEPPAKIARP
jgi:hypothetical protein